VFGRIAWVTFLLSLAAVPASAHRPASEKQTEVDLRTLEAELAKSRPERRDIVIVQVAREGARARSLWPKLVAILESGSPNERTCAAWALGWIGANEAIPALTRALASPEWRVVFAAAGVLGRFGNAARGATQQLRKVEQNHWMLAVRHRAAMAKEGIEHPERVGIAGPHRKEPDDPNAWERDLHQFRDEAFGRFTDDPCGIRSATEVRVGEQWIDVPRARDNRRRPAEIDRLPPRALGKRHTRGTIAGPVEVAGGWLVGTHGGEWGGDLRFVRHSGRIERLWPKNIHSLIQSGHNIFVTAEDRVLVGPPSSEVLKVLLTPSPPRRWVARHLLSLPARELMSIPIENGAVLFLTDHGAVSVREDETMHEEACPERASEVTSLVETAETLVETHRRTAKPTSRDGINPSAVEGHLDDVAALLGVILNHPRILPFFHLEQSPTARPRVEAPPTPLLRLPILVAGREVSWVDAAAAARSPKLFRILDLAFDSATAASVAFAYEAEGVEGYAVLEKRDEVWHIAGITVVEQ
jgi:hypothetical protein